MAGGISFCCLVPITAPETKVVSNYGLSVSYLSNSLANKVNVIAAPMMIDEGVNDSYYIDNKAFVRGSSWFLECDDLQSTNADACAKASRQCREGEKWKKGTRKRKGKRC